MNNEANPVLTDERVLVLAPTWMDGEMSHSILTEAGMGSLVCRDPDELCREIANGCGAILFTEEAVLHDDYPRLVGVLEDQPRWSDLPVIVLTRGGADSAVAA